MFQEPEMDLKFVEHRQVSLKEIGKDEKWLQNEIARNPAILGPGELTLYRKEVKQSAGGRLDMLLSDPDGATLYEVEIQLGETDPSHIIRTIEYWDIESRKYRDREHWAVIVAEKISSRFFNVIWLLNRTLPIIAIELAVLRSDDSFLLHFTKVLDIYQQPDVLEDQPEILVNRQYWEESSPEAMAVFDRLLRMLRDRSLEPKLNFRQADIALAGKWNFAYAKPLKSGELLLSVGRRIPAESRKAIREKFEQDGIAIKIRTEDRFVAHINSGNLERATDSIANLVRSGLDLKADLD
jgi:hypothetical protein